MTIIEAVDYIKDIDINGIVLTESGRAAAITILEQRKGWTSEHGIMLEKVASGKSPLPLKLARLVSRTRLGDAIDLIKDMNRKHIRNQKAKARRKAIKARKGMAA